MRFPSIIILFLCSCLLSSYSFAQEDKNAKEQKAKILFEEAELHYNVGEYQEALQKYKDAYFLSNHPEFLFNLGQCYRNLNRYQEAITTYNSYLREVPDSPYRAEVTQHIRTLETKQKEELTDKTSYAKVVIISNPPGAQIRVGDKNAPVFATTPYTEEEFSPGDYQFVLTLDGYESQTMSLHVEAGKEYMIPELRLQAKAPARERKNFIGAGLLSGGLRSNDNNNIGDLNLSGFDLQYRRVFCSKRCSIGGHVSFISDLGDNQAQNSSILIGVPFAYRIPLTKQGRIRFEPTIEIGGIRHFIDTGDIQFEAGTGGYGHIAAVFSYLLQDRHLFTIQPIGIGAGALQGQVLNIDFIAEFAYFDLSVGYSFGF